MKKIGLFLTVAFFVAGALSPISLIAQPATSPTPQVLVQTKSEAKFETLKGLLNDLKLVERKTFDDKIVYDVEFHSFSFLRANKIIIEAVPAEIKTKYVAYRFESDQKTIEFLRLEVNLMESYKTFVFDYNKTYETANDGIRTTKETEKSVDIHITFNMEDSASLNNDEVAAMIGKINRAIKENRPLTFICDSVMLYPFHFDKFDYSSKIDIYLYIQEITED